MELDAFRAAVDRWLDENAEALAPESAGPTTLDQQMVQVALVGRYYERMADHAVNIGERVTYMVTGEIPGPDGASSDDSLGIRLD